MTWRVVPGQSLDPSVAGHAASRGADVALLDAGATLPGTVGGRWLLGVSVDEAQTRVPTRVLGLLDRLGTRAIGLVLQGASTGQIKAGRAVDRLSRLRQERGLPLWCVEATDNVLDAEWLIENTPTHGVLLRYDRLDQSAAFRALKSASDLGVAVMAAPRTSPEVLEDARFLVADQRVTCIVLPLPGSMAQLEEALQVTRSPMSDRQRETLWQAYQADHPEPKRPRHGHVIDE